MVCVTLYSKIVGVVGKGQHRSGGKSTLNLKNASFTLGVLVDVKPLLDNAC